LPPRLAARAASCFELALPAVAGPWRRETWSAPDGATALLAWSNEYDVTEDARALYTDGERALGVAGALVRQDAVPRLALAPDLGAAADEMAGVFGLFRADQRGFVAVTTVVRVDPVYHASTGGVSIAGNRALLVHLLARAVEEPDRDPPRLRHDLLAMQSFVRSGYYLSDDTPFAGVKALPAHCSLDVRDGSATLHRRPVPVAAQRAPLGRARRDQLRRLGEALEEAVEPLRSSASPIELSLTGGRDSRLVAAALHAAQIPFHAFTWGFDDHPDVVLAGRIARLLGVDHRSQSPRRNDDGNAVVVSHPLARAWHVIHATEGLISAINNVATPGPFTGSRRVIGMGGEQLRGGFLYNQTDPTPESIERRVVALFTGWRELMTDAANERAREDLEPWAEWTRRDPLDALDKIYLYYRTGRWAAAGRAAASVTSEGYYPLLDNRVTRQAIGLSARWRWSEQPVYRVISVLAPQLRNQPLANRRWRFESARPLLYFGRRPWLARAELRGTGGTSSFDWRRSPDAGLRRLMAEQILDGPSALFEIVRRHEVERLLAEDLRPTVSDFVWNMFTASALLAGDWLGTRPTLPPVTVPIR
jgi:hypothetical protein